MKVEKRDAVGPGCSILLGISYVLLALFHAVLPSAQQTIGSSAFFLSLAGNPVPFMLEYGAAAAGALLAFGAVPAIADAVCVGKLGALRWLTNLAYLGFAVVAIDSLRAVVSEPERASIFAAGGRITRTAIWATDDLLPLDVQGWYAFGAVGLWVFAANVRALRQGLLPTPLACMGVVAAVCYWLVVAGYVLHIEWLFTIAAVLGGAISAPVWYIGMGFILWPRDSTEDESRAASPSGRGVLRRVRSV